MWNDLIALGRKKTALAVIVVAAVLSGCMGDKDPVVDRSPRDRPRPRPSCSEPELRPAYLPWLTRNAKRARPEVTEEDGRWVLGWVDPSTTGPRARTVTLTVRAQQDLKRYAGEFEPVSVRGHDGYLVWIGDPGVGQLALFWNEGGSCTAYGLFLLLPGRTQRATEEEILKVARSLTTNY